MTDNEILQHAKQKFHVFLLLIWRHLNLPAPTEIQKDIAEYLQYGGRRILIHGFRGVAKSWITSAYVLWKLWGDPQYKFLVVSASKGRADNFTRFTRRLIDEVWFLRHLAPLPSQRDSTVSFDVAPAAAAQAPSVRSAGITGQITGDRANEVIADDIEIQNNSLTVGQREKLLEAVKEFDSIIVPGGRIVFLGTHQSVESIYVTLKKRGFKPRYWTARIPLPEKMSSYGDDLAPLVLDKIKNGAMPWDPLEPTRFTDQDLIERELSIGRSTFNLQFMLDTSLADGERYPLKLKDLVIMPLDINRAPASIQAGSGLKQHEITGIPLIGMSGDRWYSPFFTSQERLEYQGKLLTIDPKGRGKDELAWNVTGQLHGNIFVLDHGGLNGGYDEITLKKLANIAKKYQINKVVVESNFGDGMFTALFAPVLNKIYPCRIEEVKHSIQKEARIIDTLEPLFNQHRVIFDQRCVEADIQEAMDNESESGNVKSLFYQMTRLTRDRGALKHDDRIDCLAIACADWLKTLNQDDELREKEYQEELREEAIEKFIQSCQNGIIVGSKQIIPKDYLNILSGNRRDQDSNKFSMTFMNPD